MIVYKLTVVAPIPKATISVNDVTVIDTPACRNINDIFSCIGCVASSGVKLVKAPTITKTSSTPIPE